MNRKINNKSDFDFILRLVDADGNPVGWVEANWELSLYTTSKTFAYNASYAYGEKNNCAKTEDGNILIVVDGHEFPIGELLADFAVDIPDTRFPDGSRHVSVTAENTDIEMVLERGLEAKDMEVTIRVPHLRKEEAPAEPEKGKDEPVEG